MIKNFVLITVAFIFSFGTLASCDEGKKDQQPFDIKKETIEVQAQDFDLKDLSGKTHSLSDYKGKTVLLNFTTTWCPYCIKDIPNLKKMYRTYEDKGFELIAIYIQESNQKVASFAQKYDLPYTILLDTEGMVARSYRVRGVPTKVLVNKQGTILCRACRTLEVMLEQEMGSGK
jgi:peroxiredoxin